MNNPVMFGILITLMSRPATKRYLAEKFEISERTVIRYIDALAASGVPVYSIRGAKGGYAISDEYQFDKTYFTEGELQQMLSLLKKDGNENKLNDFIADKLQYLTKRKKEGAYLINTDNLIIDAGSWHNPTLYRSKMETLQRSITAKKSVKLMYIDRYESTSHRLFDPYHIVLKDGVWYTYGWCHSRKAFRLFRLARIKSLIRTDQSFERKESNILAKLEGDFDDYETVEIEFEFSSTILADIEEWLGPDAVYERGIKYIAKASLFGGRNLLMKLLSFGSSIKILSPVSLREEVLTECKRVLRTFE
jgi:predicted DNA-binding transcriptional regulator YafY